VHVHYKVEVLTGPNLSTPAHYSGTAVYVLVFNSALAYKGAYQLLNMFTFHWLFIQCQISTFFKD